MSTFQAVQKGQEWRAQAPAARVELPAGRLRRLGADPQRMEVWEALWLRLQVDARDGFLEDLATMTDADLEDMLEGQPVFAAGQRTTIEIDRWARTAAHREIAAALAIVVEESAEQPRAGLIKRLAGIR